MRRRRQHGQAPGLGSDLARGRGDILGLWRLRLCQGIRHRAQMARSPPLPDRADLDQPDPRLYRPARPRHAAVLLNLQRRTLIKVSAAAAVSGPTAVTVSRALARDEHVAGCGDTVVWRAMGSPLHGVPALNGHTDTIPDIV